MAAKETGERRRWGRGIRSLNVKKRKRKFNVVFIVQAESGFTVERRRGYKKQIDTITYIKKTT